MKKLIVLMILVVFFMTGCSTEVMESKMISVNEVNRIIENFENEENVIIIDVREVDEYEEGHLINSYNVPLSRIDDIKNVENIALDSKIIVYCRSGNRSKTAQTRLEELGYTNVYDMGGISSWPYDVVTD